VNNIAAAALGVLVAASTSPSLTARLSAPRKVEAGKSFVLTVEIGNPSSEGFLYRQHWKWASNTMSFEARGSDGHVFTSEPLLFDIDARADCFYTKALGPKERFTFDVAVNGSSLASLRLRFPGPGRYEVTWVYEFATELADSKLKCFNTPFWEGKLRSNTVVVEVAK
jgi:hypothetical protein